MPVHKLEADFSTFSHQILSFANNVIPRVDFLRGISQMLLGFSRCDVMELWLKEDGENTRCVISRRTEHSFLYETMVGSGDTGGKSLPDSDGYAHVSLDKIFGRIRRDMLEGNQGQDLTGFTSRGNFWTGNAAEFLSSLKESDYRQLPPDPGYLSLALIRLKFVDRNIGLMQLMSRNRDHFTEPEIKLYEELAQTVGIALVNQRTQAALRERVKELTCLYNMAKLAGQEGKTQGEILQAIAELIPPAWQYPEITACRIMLDGHSFKTHGFQPGWQKQTADVVIKDRRRGAVEVVYLKTKPVLDEGPFLREERNLLEVIAKQVALIVERRETREESMKLQEQLRHADRLATIGQLAAGVAHELNEPLGNILGFAQLIKKSPELPDQTDRDVDKIVNASLHAREIIRKLMIFARQAPPRTGRVQLNQVVEEGLYFFEARCAKAGIELIHQLDPSIPEITGDKSQLNQVLVNLLVNSIQAMPHGGKLTIKTSSEDNFVSLVVEDTGTGMSEDIVQKIFVPFFTTKDVDEGTGLGLAVVHGIIASHKGTIEVKSAVGQGARFEIRLPAA
jgi:two-component system NtrC family sensor kinase